MKLFLSQIRSLVRLSFLELWRRNDVWGLLVLAVALMVPLASLSPFGADGATRYLQEMALLLLWAFSLFISIGVGARLFPPEFESRTIYPLLAKPISRGRLLVGKYLGALAAAFSALAFFYVLFFTGLLCRGESVGLAAVQGVILHFFFVALVVALSLLGSLLMSASANATVTSVLVLGMYFFGRRLPEIAETAGGIPGGIIRFVYALAPHVEFFDMRQRIVHAWGPVDASVFLVVIAYGLVYTGVLLACATVVLKRKRL